MRWRLVSLLLAYVGNREGLACDGTESLLAFLLAGKLAAGSRKLGVAIDGSKYPVWFGNEIVDFLLCVTVGYIPTPADANAITSVDYKVDDTANFSIDNSGKITLTTIGNLNPLSSIATKVTVTVTNADGSTAMSEFTFTITKA